MGDGQHGPGRTAEIAARLRAYIVQRPDAADSLRGLGEWWLADLLPPASDAELLTALELLDREGVLERLRLDDGTEIWRRARG